VLYGLVLLLFLPAVLGALQLEGLLSPVRDMVDKILAVLPNLLAAAVFAWSTWRAIAVFDEVIDLRWRRWKSDWEQTLADWDFIMDTNLKGLLLLSRMCVPLMVERGGGDIVHISTYYVLPAKSPGTNNPDTDLYNASKWALNGFTQAWASSLAEHSIRVNALCMGATDTPMLRGLFDGDPPADFAATWMQPAQIAQQLIDLLHDGRTGENIGAWIGEPVELGPRKPAHRTVTG